MCSFFSFKKTAAAVAVAALILPFTYAKADDTTARSGAAMQAYHFEMRRVHQQNQMLHSQARAEAQRLLHSQARAEVQRRLAAMQVDGTQPSDAVTVRQLESALAAASGSQISEMQSTERRVSAGVAMALAMSQPVSIAPGDTSAFTAAAGNFNGQSALAIGVHHTPIPGLLYSAGLGITTGSSSPAIRVGFSLSF